MWIFFLNNLCGVFSRMNVYIYLVREQSPLAAKVSISPRFANATAVWLCLDLDFNQNLEGVRIVCTRGLIKPHFNVHLSRSVIPS